MKRRIPVFYMMLFLLLPLLFSCKDAESVTLEAGACDACEISGIEGSEFAEGYDTSALRVVGKHSVPILIDGRLRKYSVEVVDTTAPVIEVGEIHVNVGDGVAWRKQIKVTDNSEGEIEIEVDPSGVNTSKEGTYLVRYTVTDASGNSATAEATVIVGIKEIGEDMLNAELDKVIARIISDTMTAEQMVRAVYAYVGESITYSATPETDDPIYAAYTSLFSTGTGDCYSYFAASKAFFERLGIENIDMKRAEGGAAGKHYWNLVNIGTKAEPRWYHYDANPISGQYAASGCLLTDTQLAAYDAWCGQGYRKFDPEGIPASADEVITRLPELEV